MDTQLYLLFWLRKAKVNSKGTSPIFLRITVGGSRAEISTGKMIAPKQWNNHKEEVKGNSEEAKAINAHLKIIKAKLTTVQNEILEQGIPLTAEGLKVSYLGKDKNAKTLLQAFFSHNNQLKQRLGSDVSKSTFGKYETVKGKVVNYITEKLTRTDILLKELDYQFIAEFELYLKTKDKISHNTSMKYIKFVKRIINYSIANGWLMSNPFINFKCKFQDRQRGYLTAEELSRIENKSLPISRIMAVRDMFIFCCYTGLAFCDLFKLKNTNLINKEGGKWIVINRTKTGVRSAIPLLPKAAEILTKYSPPFEPDGDYNLLPVLSNQKMNAYLKEVGDICSINKNLTMHLARHTFATTVTLTNGVPIESVSKMLGHTAISTTQIYSKVVDTKIDNDMRALVKKLA